MVQGSPAARADESLSGLTGRQAAIARRRQLIGAPAAVAIGSEADGDRSESGHDAGPGERVPSRATSARPGRKAVPVRAKVATATPSMSRGRRLSMARRAATAARGRSGLEALGGRSNGSTSAAMWRDAGASSREIAKKVRQERCEQGKACEVAPRPTGRVRPRSRAGGADGNASKTASGQSISGTRVGRSTRTTGDEPGACAPITGTEYFGAELFQEFCGVTPQPWPETHAANTTKGQTVTGSRVGRGVKVTGDESGAGRTLTGTQYTAPGPEGGPPKVGTTQTYSGGGVTGSLIGRSSRVTGDEPGSCARVTGNEYVGFEQYDRFCQVKPEPTGDKKVGTDATWRGQAVTGARIGRAEQVTGDEPGTCEVITGSPYIGPSQYAAFCGTSGTDAARQRVRTQRATPGASLTGQSPGLGGSVTGDERGTCQGVTGTPYVGGDQFFAACGQGADSAPGSADYPQPLAGGNWGAFSIQSPARVAQATGMAGQITGTTYSQEEGRITGPFNRGRGVVTGTEDFRLRQGEGSPPAMPMGARAAAPQRPQPAEAQAAMEEAARPRITGEGLDGRRITGDDWGRNERVTGTEGLSSAGRNPTRRGGAMGAFAGARAFRESQAREIPPLRVTGSSGATERGAVVTVSGGARG